MTQLLVAHVKLKMILKLIQKFNPCVNTSSTVVLHEQLAATLKHSALFSQGIFMGSV